MLRKAFLSGLGAACRWEEGEGSQSVQWHRRGARLAGDPSQGTGTGLAPKPWQQSTELSTWLLGHRAKSPVPNTSRDGTAGAGTV